MRDMSQRGHLLRTEMLLDDRGLLGESLRRGGEIRLPPRYPAHKQGVRTITPGRDDCASDLAHSLVMIENPEGSVAHVAMQEHTRLTSYDRARNARLLRAGLH